MNAAFTIPAALATLVLAGAAHGQEPATADQRVQSGAQTTAQTDGAQLYASPSQVRLVQEKLREQGRKPGEDGVWDDATVAEVRDFQKANGLAPTGQLDTSLLGALEIGDVLEGETSSRFLDGLLSGDRSDEHEAGGRGAPLYVSPAHIAQIQHLLREQGHYEGQIDGVWGEETSRAANKFREEKGLEASVHLDIALLRVLNRQRSDVPKLASEATSQTEGVPLEAGPVAIRALQRELREQGHETRAIDGMWGENTRQALRDFQQEHDLEATGTLTLPTLAALGVNVASESGSDSRGFEARSRTDGVAEAEQDPDGVATTEPQN